jgi:Fe-S cluster assembly iron-binding protein IscA
MVFSLTPAAASAMTEARGEVGAPDEWGIRFFGRTDVSGGITFDFVAGPEPDDSLGGSSSMRTYVDAAIHQRIGDATVDFQDLDGSAELVIRPHRNSGSR